MGKSSVAAIDGTQLTVETVGTGPGLVLLHGGGVVSADYRRLVNGLAGRCTVHTYDRRGYGNGIPLPTEGTQLSTTLDDLSAVLDATGATQLFGHSGGAFYALQAALSMPLDAVAVYDPPLPVDGLLPTDWLEPFAAAVQANDPVTAMVEMGRGMDSAGPVASRLPVAVQKAAVRLFVHTPIGRHLASMMPATLPDVRAIAATAGPATDYAGISARVLLACGATGPGYYGPICDRLAEVIPRGTSIRIPKASHNAANIARPAFVAPFADFFTAAV